MKDGYSKFVPLVSKSDRDAESPGILNNPDLFNEVNELEKSRSRHLPPAALSIELPLYIINSGASPSSSQKRYRKTAMGSLCHFERAQERRHDALLAQMKEANAQQCRLNDILGVFSAALSDVLSLSMYVV